MDTAQRTPRPVATTHLQSWSDERSIEAAGQVAEMLETPAWQALMQAVDSYRAQTYARLEHKAPSDSAAEYASEIGAAKGVAVIESIANGIVKNGQLRAQKASEKES